MITADIHAELIAAFLGDDEPRYGECRCASCLGPRRGSAPCERTIRQGAASASSSVSPARPERAPGAPRHSVN
jgi:hypothetical protein